MFVYLAAGTALQLPGREFGYDALAMVAANLFGASVVYMHEKTSRMRFLEACLLREMVARDGLTGIQNRRMFDQHIQRVWQQAVREEERVAVLLADIDCFKDYNDRYGHQAGDECLRAVAVSLSQCARRPLDFVARYGGEEFAVVLYEASREYVAEVLTRIQRSIAELNIPHEASRVASRLTVSIGAAFILPSSDRTLEGLIQLADEALYSAKEQGRNRVVVMEAEYHTLRTGRFEKRRSAAPRRPARVRRRVSSAVDGASHGRVFAGFAARLARNMPSELNSMAISPAAVDGDDAALALQCRQFLEHHFAHRLAQACGRRSACARRCRAPPRRG